MAPPNRYRKISRNRAPWMVPSTTSWGVRRYFSRPRRAMPRVLAGRPAERRTEKGTVAMVGLSSQAAGWPAGTGWSMPWPVRGRNTSSRAGGRRAMSSTATPAASRAPRASRSRSLPASTPTLTRRGGSPTCAPPGAGGAQSGGDSWQVGLVAHVDLDDVAAGLLLELAGGAGGDGPAVVDDHDAAGQVVGLVQVLGGEEHVGAGGDQAADGGPERAAAARVHTGGPLAVTDD